MLSLMSGTNMRGLNQFIADIRECKDKESETKRVDLELAKIREKFTTEKGLNAYQRKKYVWKLLYIHILGYEVDFGFHEAAGLINSSKYDEKYTGYIATALLVSEGNIQIWKSISYSIQADLRSKNQNAQSMALSMIASIAPKTLMDSHSEIITDLAINSRTLTSVRKKAVLCLTRMIKKEPNKYDLKKFISPISEMFESKSSLSLVNSAASLLLTLMSLMNPEVLKQSLMEKVIRLLHRLSINKQSSTNYIYFTVANPWLQMKLFKALQTWSPPEEKGSNDLVEEIVSKMLKRTYTMDNQTQKSNVNKHNVEYGLLFEAINLVIHYGDRLDKKFISNINSILAIFINLKGSNICYLGLEAMCKLAVRFNMSEHERSILTNLNSLDVSIRKRALELLYLICNSTNVSNIVAELLGYLQNRVDPHIHDDLVLKIAILAEKFAVNLLWYVDVVVNLIQNAEVENDIWYRIIQIITGFGQTNQELQQYAALKLFTTMSYPHVTNTLVCVGSYVLSEFSDHLVKAGKEPKKIFDVINKHFSSGTNKSKAMMLNAFAKLAIKYEQLKEEAQMVCHMCSEHWDPDVQQRGVEFLVLFVQEDGIQKKVLSENPVFTEEQQQANPLLKKFAKTSKKGKDSQNQKSVINNKQAGTSSISNSSTAGFQNMASSSAVTSHPLANHPFFRASLDKLCPNLINLMDIPGKWDLKPYWKEAFIKKCAFDGAEIREKVEEGVLKLILSVSVQTAEMQIKVFRSKGFEVTTSPIKYSADVQQIMMSFCPNGEKIEPPAVGVAWKDQNGQIQKKELQLPIAISKFINPVELGAEKFNGFYKEYSLPNPTFYKIDSFLKVPEGVKSADYLKKIGAFLGSICNISCTASPSPANLKLIFGSGVITLKTDGKPVDCPILVEAECYESEKGGAVRVSLRGGNGNSIHSLYQLIIAFF